MERATQRNWDRSGALNPIRCAQNSPAGGRAVAGSNPVSPITTKGPQTRAFLRLPSRSRRVRRGTNGENLLHGRGEFPAGGALPGMKRSHGSGHLYVKRGSYYGRWRGVDGRLINTKIGKVRTRGEGDGISRADAERGLRRLVDAETRLPPSPEEQSRTVDEVADELRERPAIEGARCRIARTASRCSGCTSRRRSASAGSRASRARTLSA
jgi:hypothetical protein